MPRRPRKSATLPRPEDSEVEEIQDQEEVSESVEVEEVPPAEEEEKPKKPRRGRRSGARVDVRMSGDASSVREAMESYSPSSDEGEEPEGNPEEDGKIAAALADPKNFVMVHRLYPRRFDGRRVDRRVEQFRCPIPKEDIEEDICSRHGGKRYLATIHPNTPTGAAKTLASFFFENQDTDEPIFPDDEGNEGVEDDVNLLDRPVSDPLVEMEESINRQLRVQNKMSQLQQAKQMLADLKSEARAGAGSKKEGDDRVQALEDRLQLSQFERQIDGKISSLERHLEKMAERETRLASQKNGGDSLSQMMPLFLQMMRSSDQKFQDMMTAFTANLSSKRDEPKEDPLDRLIKMKTLLGDNGKNSKIEDALMELAMERLTGDRADAEEESDVKYAVKQLVPVARSYIDRKLAAGDGQRAPTQEEFKQAVREEAMRITKNTLGDMQQQGYLVRTPQASDKKGISHDPKKKIGAPEKPPKQKPEGDTPRPHEHEVEEVDSRSEGREETDMNLPPSPQSPAYDRAKAVNFVLDSIVDDMDRCPEDSFVVGDIMDRLDDELLEQFLKISTGDELKALIKPYADPEKLKAVEEKGKGDRQKSWLTRMVVTAQDELRREWDAGTPQGAERAS